MTAVAWTCHTCRATSENPELMCGDPQCPIKSRLQREAMIKLEPPRLSLWVDHQRRHMHWDFDNGPLDISFPKVVKPDEIADLEQLLGLFIAGLKRTAQGIESAIAQLPQPDREQ